MPSWRPDRIPSKTPPAPQAAPRRGADARPARCPGPPPASATQRSSPRSRHRTRAPSARGAAATARANDMATPIAARRLQRELAALAREPVPHIVARPLEDNILEWHYVIAAAADTPYAGGHYHGRLRFPADYPLRPPAVLMLTPRRAASRRTGGSASRWTSESWNPMWTGGHPDGPLRFMLEDASARLRRRDGRAASRARGAEPRVQRPRRPVPLPPLPGARRGHDARREAAAAAAPRPARRPRRPPRRRRRRRSGAPAAARVLPRRRGVRGVRGDGRSSARRLTHPPGLLRLDHPRAFPWCRRTGVATVDAVGGDDETRACCRRARRGEQGLRRQPGPRRQKGWGHSPRTGLRARRAGADRHFPFGSSRVATPREAGSSRLAGAHTPSERTGGVFARPNPSRRRVGQYCVAPLGQGVAQPQKLEGQRRRLCGNQNRRVRAESPRVLTPSTRRCSSVRCRSSR